MPIYSNWIDLIRVIYLWRKLFFAIIYLSWLHIEKEIQLKIFRDKSRMKVGEMKINTYSFFLCILLIDLFQMVLLSCLPISLEFFFSIFVFFSLVNTRTLFRWRNRKKVRSSFRFLFKLNPQQFEHTQALTIILL